MSEEIQAEARRQLEQLRAARGDGPRPPHSLGELFPPTTGLRVPLEEWAAADPWDDEESPPAP